MPYSWTSEADVTRLHLRPHRSLPKGGFVIFIAITCAMLTLPLLRFLGSGGLWIVLAFLVITVAGVWFALQWTYRTGKTSEVLSIDPVTTHLLRTAPSGATQEWSCNTYWVQVTQYATDGPVRQYITLRGQDREVELGAFLSEDERIALFDEVQAALNQARQNPQ